MLKKFERWKYILMDVDPYILFYAAGPTYLSNNLVYKSVPQGKKCLHSATVLLLGSFSHVIFISMSIIEKSETILLLFHCQILNIFFIATCVFNTGFKHLVQKRVTVLFVLYRRELYYKFEKNWKRSNRNFVHLFFLFVLFITSVCPRQDLQHSANPTH